jgi:hypothetical protein
MALLQASPTISVLATPLLCKRKKQWRLFHTLEYKKDAMLRD